MAAQTKTQNAPGFLIVFEGIDGSGKSTQIATLKKYIQKKYHRKVVISEWKGSRIIGKFLREVDSQEVKPTPLALSLITAGDLNERLQKEIKPALAAGKIVICDRYFYTAMVRDAVVNKIDATWVEKLYSHLPQPDLVVYLSVNDATSVQRVDNRIQNGFKKIEKDLKKRGKKVSSKRILREIRQLEGSLGGASMAGTMMNVVQMLQHGEKLYQMNGEPLTVEVAQRDRIELVNRLIQEYHSLYKKYGFVRLDAMQSIKRVFNDVKRAVQEKLGAPAIE